MTDVGSKGNHLQIAWLCGLAACLSIASYGQVHQRSDNSFERPAAVRFAQDSEASEATRPVPAELAVYIDLHHARDTRESLPPQGLVCRD